MSCEGRNDCQLSDVYCDNVPLRKVMLIGISPLDSLDSTILFSGQARQDKTDSSKEGAKGELATEEGGEFVFQSSFWERCYVSAIFFSRATNNRFAGKEGNERQMKYIFLNTIKLIIKKPTMIRLVTCVL